MFPTDPHFKKQFMDLVGGRLAKTGDSYDKGSAFFTKASQLIDDLERRYMLDCEDDSDKIRKANGLHVPKYKHYKPILSRQKSHF